MAGDRATTLSGSFQKITIGATSKVLGAGTYTISGATRKTVDVSEFGVDIDIFEFASADGGTIAIANASFDPTDPMQEYLRTCVESGIKLTGGSGGSTSTLQFWINSSSRMMCGTSGHILLTSAGNVESDRSGVSRTSFNGQVSGAFMYLGA